VQDVNIVAAAPLSPTGANSYQHVDELCRCILGFQCVLTGEQLDDGGYSEPADRVRRVGR